jgi:putative flippase GtrA
MVLDAQTVNRLFRFGALGGVGFVVNLGLTALLHELVGLSEELSFAISLAAVFFGNFLSLRHLVFDASHGDPKRQLAHYAAASFCFRFAQWLSFLALHTWLGVPYLIAVAVVLGSWFLVKFFYYRSRIFKSQTDNKLQE